jgi:hypothetical protein
MGAKVVFLAPTGEHAAAAPRRVLVPRDALVTRDGRTMVWVVTEGIARAVAVEAGPERGDQIEVRQGLSGGESVVLQPPADLKNGARVRAATGQ